MPKQITIKDLIPDDQNFNTGNEFGEALIEKSFSKFGAGRSILLDKNNKIIAGNKSLQKYAEGGGENVVVVETTGDQIVAVKRTDIDLDTKRGREMALADNASAKANISWDFDALKEWEMPTDEWGVFIDEPEPELIEDDEAASEAISKAAELQIKWQTATGQLWKLGDHRLLCGDATVKSDVERLLGQETPNLMVTDPPYGVDYHPEWRDEAAAAGLISYAASRVAPVLNDTQADWSLAWQLFPGNVVYCWHASLRASIVEQSFSQNGFEPRSHIVWAKRRFAISRGHYHWQHELCIYAVRNGQNASWIGDRSQTTLWTEDVDSNVDGGHSTQKPVSIMVRPIQNHEGDVYDPFLGSGTTLIACEQLNRKCRAIEISDAYVAVALERWANLTGQTPELIEKAVAAIT